MNLSDRDKQVIWHPYTQMQNAEMPIAIVKGEGAYLFDENNNRYIDAISSWWVNTHGHSHPHIAAKVSEQLKTLEHSIFAGFTHRPAVELAERLLKVLPKNQSKIFYSDDGSTAVEVALKMSLQYWYNKQISSKSKVQSSKSKNKIIAFKNSYHGDTFGAMSVSGRSIFTKPFKEKLFDVIFIDAPTKGNEQKSLKQFQFHLSPLTSHLSIFIYEPLVQGAAGMVMYDADALNEILKFCKKNNILTIADEVFTGFGRTGKFFASDFIPTKPDIICLSKGLTGGTMALGVTTCSEEIYNAFLSSEITNPKSEIKTFFHGHSFTANPVACSAALASLDLFDKKETWKNIKRIEKKHNQFLKHISKHKRIKEIRQLGTILAIEIKTNSETNYLNEIRTYLYQFFIQRKIIIRPLGNIVYLVPPYCISDEDLDFIYENMEECLDKIKVINNHSSF